MSAVKKIMPRAHLERMRGNSVQAAHYCQKDGAWIQFGEVPICQAQKQSEKLKKRWEDAWHSAKVDHDLEAIPADMRCRQYHAWKRIMQDNPIQCQNLLVKDNLWLVAPTQYGKSTYVREKYPDNFDKGPNKWFIGYKNQRTIILDDFGPKQCEYLGWYMKRWADLFPFPIESKGGGRMIRPAHIVVTSQYHIDECFEDPLVRDAIKERFQERELLHWTTREANKKEKALQQLRDELHTDEVLASVDEDLSVDTQATTIPYDVDAVISHDDFENETEVDMTSSAMPNFEQQNYNMRTPTAQSILKAWNKRDP